MLNSDMAIGERCEHCALSMGQPWCEKLGRQLPTVEGITPLTPSDCPIKLLVDSNCVIVKTVEPNLSEAE